MQKLTIVFPDETSNIKEMEKIGKDIKLKETPSGYFAETLLQLGNLEYFSIPREIIKKIQDKKGKFSLDDIQKCNKEFPKN